MSGSETRQRTRLVGVRLTPSEHDALLAEAKAVGVSVAELLRRRALAAISHTRRDTPADPGHTGGTE